MTDKIGHIKNPLTIIAIFAGLAEVGGTIVLPFLRPCTQETYVWFLMLFPTLLVGVFFYVLYNKHQVLYAPSDYRDDSTFKDIIQTNLTAQNVRKLETTSKALAEGQTKAAAGATAPPFATLPSQTRKVLKTLWTFQQKQFPNDMSKRWGFGVALGSPEYMAYSLGVVDAIKLDLVAIEGRGFCYLTDVGFAYCKQHEAAITADTELYSSFSN